MWAVTVSIKFQNKLAKEAILSALKIKSSNMFQGEGITDYIHLIGAGHLT